MAENFYEKAILRPRPQEARELKFLSITLA